MFLIFNWFVQSDQIIFMQTILMNILMTKTLIPLLGIHRYNHAHRTYNQAAEASNKLVLRQASYDYPTRIFNH